MAMHIIAVLILSTCTTTESDLSGVKTRMDYSLGSNSTIWADYKDWYLLVKFDVLYWMKLGVKHSGKCSGGALLFCVGGWVNGVLYPSPLHALPPSLHRWFVHGNVFRSMKQKVYILVSATGHVN